MNDKLQAIRAKCIEANPEGTYTIWACEGCQTVYAEYINGCPKCWNDNMTREENLIRYPERSVTLRQRPIHIADVLYAATKNWTRDTARLNTFIFFGNEKNTLLCLVALWDFLNDDLEKQPPENVAEIYNLLHT